LPKDWQSCSHQKIRDELINRKALVTEEASYIQMNFSIYFKHKEIHDFAAKRLEIIKKALDNGEPLGNDWKFGHPSKVVYSYRKQPQNKF